MASAKKTDNLRQMVFVLFVLFVFLLCPLSAEAKTSLQEMGFNLPQNTIQRPTAAVRTADGKTYVCDAAKQHIAVFSAENTPLFTFDENLSLPIDIVLSDTKVFVLDETLHSVLVYAYDGSYIDTLGEQGISAGQFYQPNALAIDRQTLYVSDTGNNRIQLFDTETLDLLTIFAVEENGTDLSAPSACAVSGDILYVVEADGAEVNTYDKSTRRTLGNSTFPCG